MADIIIGNAAEIVSKVTDVEGKVDALAELTGNKVDIYIYNPDTGEYKTVFGLLNYIQLAILPE